MARCKILNNNVELNAADIRNLINQISGNQPLLDSIIYDNFNRMKLEDKITYIDARDYIMQTFNLSVAEFTETIERAGTKRHSMSGKPLGFESVGTLINSSEDSFGNKLARYWHNVARGFTSMGAFYAYRGTEEGRMAAEITKRKSDKISVQAEVLKNNINLLNLFLSKNKKFFKFEDYAALTAILNNEVPQNQGRFDNLSIHMLVDSGKLTQQQVDEILKDLSEIIDKFRLHIDILSELVSKMPGFLNFPMFRTFIDNLGKYTVTAYRIHRESDYAKNFEYVKGSTTIKNLQFQALYDRALNDFVTFFKIKLKALNRYKKIKQASLNRINTLLSKNLSQEDREYNTQEAEKIQKIIANIDAEIDYIENRVLVNNGINHEMNIEIVGYLINMNKSADAGNLPNLKEGFGKSRLGRDLVKRKTTNIPQAIKDLMGQYKDIKDVYSLSILKLTEMYANAEYQLKIAELNDLLISKGIPPFFSLSPDHNNGLTESWSVPQTYPVLISALGITPQQNVYLTKDMKDVFDNTQKDLNFILKAIVDLDPIIKANLVVRNHRSIIRNFIAWWTRVIPAILFARNKKQVLKLFVAAIKRRLKEELYRIANIANRNKMYGYKKETLLNKRTPEEDRRRLLLIEQGLKSSELIVSESKKSFSRMHDDNPSVTARALNALDNFLNKDLNFSNPIEAFASIIRVAGILLKDSFATFGRLFAGGDDLIKELLFDIELENASYVQHGMSYSDASNSLTADQITNIENIAGNFVRRTAPNFNEAWEVTKWFQKNLGILIGPFISYPMEGLRSTRNMFVKSMQQLKNNEVDANVSKRMRNDGYRRLLSYTVTTILSTTAGGSLIFGGVVGGVFLAKSIAGTLGYGWGPDDDEEDKKFGLKDKAGVLKYYGYTPEYMSGSAYIIDVGDFIYAIDPTILNIHGTFMNTLEGGIDSGFDFVTGEYDESTKKKLAQIVKDFLNPFVEQSPSIKAIDHYLHNKDKYGNPIPEDSDKRSLLSASGEFTENLLIPGTVKTVMSSSEKKQRVKKIEEDLSVINMLINKGGEKSKIDVLVERSKILHRELSLAREKVKIDEGVNQFLALGVIAIDPGSSLPDPVFNKIMDVKKTNSNLAYKIGVMKSGDDTADLIYDAKKEYKNDIEYLKKWYIAMKRMGYGESVARLIKYGDMRSWGKEQAKKQPMLSKTQMAYIMGETDKFPKANLSAAEWAKMRSEIGESVN